jgi:hypothetical protein
MQQPPLSFWEYQTYAADVDVVIIGSGIVGLTAAIALREANPRCKVLVVERGSIPTGASTRNAGFACFGSLSELLDDMQTRPESEVFALVERRYRGLQRLRTRLGDAAIGYEPLGGYELFSPADAPLYHACAEKIPFFNKELAHLTQTAATYRQANAEISHMGFGNTQHLIQNTAEGQIDTGKMMDSLLRLAHLRGVLVLNGIGITTIEDVAAGVRLHTDSGWELQTPRVLVCTNGMAQRLLPHLAVTPARNQVLITEPLPTLPFRGSFHYDKGYVYFRNVGDRILLGGGRNLDFATEATDAFGSTPIIRNYLLHLLRDIILPHQPLPAIAHEWSGILGIGEEKKPIMEFVSPHVCVAVRCGGMGVALGSLVGEEAAAMIYQA